MNKEEVERERKRGRSASNILQPHWPPSLFSFPLLLPIFTLFLLLLFLSSSSSPGVFLRWDASVPQFEDAVPGSCADAHTVLRDAGAAHPVVVAGQHTWRWRGEEIGKEGKEKKVGRGEIRRWEEKEQRKEETVCKRKEEWTCKIVLVCFLHLWNSHLKPFVSSKKRFYPTFMMSVFKCCIIKAEH